VYTSFDVQKKRLCVTFKRINISRASFARRLFVFSPRGKQAGRPNMDAIKRNKMQQKGAKMGS